MSDILDRLRGYNPPDRTIDEQRQIAVDISDAADEIQDLQSKLAEVEGERDRYKKAFKSNIAGQQYARRHNENWQRIAEEARAKLAEVEEERDSSIVQVCKVLAAIEEDLEQVERERERDKLLEMEVYAISPGDDPIVKQIKASTVVRIYEAAEIKAEQAEQKLARAMEILADDELSDSTATKCNDPTHDPRWCPTCNARVDAIYDYREAIQKELGEE